MSPETIPIVYPPNADYNKDYQKLLVDIEAQGECPLCVFPKYHQGKVHDDFDGDFWIVASNHPGSPGSQAHLLLVLKEHKQRIEELSAKEWKELHRLYSKLAKEFWKGGATLIFRSGHQQYTGGTIGHLHAQIVSGDPNSPDYPEEGILRRVG